MNLGLIGNKRTHRGHLEHTFSHLLGRNGVNAVNTKSTKTDEKYEVKWSNGVDSNVPTCARLLNVSSEKNIWSAWKTMKICYLNPRARPADDWALLNLVFGEQLLKVVSLNLIIHLIWVLESSDDCFKVAMFHDCMNSWIVYSAPVYFECSHYSI